VEAKREDAGRAARYPREKPATPPPPAKPAEKKNEPPPIEPSAPLEFTPEKKPEDKK